MISGIMFDLSKMTRLGLLNLVNYLPIGKFSQRNCQVPVQLFFHSLFMDCLKGNEIYLRM